MVRIRAAKVEGIVQDIPDIVPAGDLTAICSSSPGARRTAP
jgi:hypothetical protein